MASAPNQPRQGGAVKAFSNTNFKRTTTKRLTALGVLVSACAVVAGFATTRPAAAAPSAPPGGDAAYQVEVSGNVPGKTGGGSWYWLELDKDGGGIYAGSGWGPRPRGGGGPGTAP